jgi:hypothetical protein
MSKPKLNPDNQKMDPDELRGYGMLALQHWTRLRPLAVREMLQEGGEPLLRRAVLAAQDRAEQTYDHLRDRGVEHYSADEIVKLEFLLLPDLDDLAELNDQDPDDPSVQ